MRFRLILIVVITCWSGLARTAEFKNRVAKHDPEFALAFLRGTEFISEKPLPSGVAESQRVLEVQLAKQIADDNPELALKLGRKSLESGFSDDLLNVLRRLQRKHREQE